MHRLLNRTQSFGPSEDPFVSEAFDDLFKIWRPKKTVAEREIQRQRLTELQTDLDHRFKIDSYPQRPPCHSRRQSLDATMCRLTAPVVTNQSPTSDDTADTKNEAQPVALSITEPKVEETIQSRKTKRKNRKGEAEKKRRQAKKKDRRKKGGTQQHETTTEGNDQLAQQQAAGAETQPFSAQAKVPLSPPPPYASQPPRLSDAGIPQLGSTDVNSSCLSPAASTVSTATLPETDGPTVPLPPPYVCRNSAEGIQAMGSGAVQDLHHHISIPDTASQGPERIHPLQELEPQTTSLPDVNVVVVPSSGPEIETLVSNSAVTEEHVGADEGFRMVHASSSIETPADTLVADNELQVPNERQQPDEEEDLAFAHKIREEEGEFLRFEQRERELCLFEPNCCVQVPRFTDCVCPPRRSCCCTHFKTHCLFKTTDAVTQSMSSSSSYLKGVLGTVPEHSHTAERQEVGGAGKTDNVNKKTDSHEDLRSEDSLAAYLLNLKRENELCDFTFEIMTRDDPITRNQLNAHRIIIARSPSIAIMLKFPAYMQGHNRITAVFSEKVSMWHGFDFALENLYGAPLLDSEILHLKAMRLLGYTESTYDALRFPFGSAKAEVAYSYALAGACLHIPEVIETGIALTVGLISWETFDEILQFGLRPQDYLTTLKGFITFDPANPSSATPTTSQPGAQEFRNLWAPQIVTACLRFMVTNMKPDFILFHRRGQRPRGPPGDRNDETKPTPRDPETELPSYEIVMISWTLASLPFVYLQEAFELLHARGLLSLALAQEVVVERELNRLQGLLLWIRNGNSSSDLENAGDAKIFGYQERLVMGSDSQGSSSTEIRLERDWVGLGVPPIPAAVVDPAPSSK
ncbi:uncharacterized protein BO97DRAFT_453778 [Aspergillus homomorphus CBS 101889]|uniref:BTB domain-containing protein n=1 Tax=Aspergillus homomorphus (strain CBS 101889) TaxID=1450537 RepID=A0A395HW57_ASPHC|nr:hypothetical protein BO97DRAFT_453778 [Aspergillus homomorphus CBS 101889]RAL11653.1 hypothetical protein BO97DRAFT_453778 [Aspergillus homomorphus CBS 101889]